LRGKPQKQKQLITIAPKRGSCVEKVAKSKRKGRDAQRREYFLPWGDFDEEESIAGSHAAESHKTP
jgi:hypothetical protein